MPSPKFPFPEEWEADAVDFLSDDEVMDDDAPKVEFPETVFICGLPKVAAGEKFGKLSDLVKKKFGKDPKDPGFVLDMPVSADGETGGCAWLKFPSKKEAEKGRNRIHGQSIGKVAISAILFDDYERIMETEDSFHASSVQQKELAPLSDTRVLL